jgi:DNA replication protein DnaC
MSDVVDGLKSLSLHGMASAWPEVLGTARIKALDHEVVLHQLIKSEAAQREVRSMAYQMRIARFPAHRDLTGFDFAQAHVDANLVKQLHELQFVDSAHPQTPRASGCVSSPRWNWSMPWSLRNLRTSMGSWPIA